MTQGCVFLYSRRMQSSELDLKRKAPQGHKSLQGNLFLPLGRVDLNHQPPG